MSEPYIPKGSTNYYVKLKSWNASTGKWVWKKVSTGTDDLTTAKSLHKALSQAAEGAAALSGRSVSRSHIEAVIRGIYALAGITMEEKEKWPRIHQQMAKYLAARKSRVTPRTYKSYASYSRLWLETVPHDATLDWFTTSRASDYYDSMLDHLSPKTANERLKLVSRFYARLMVEMDYPSDPTRGVDTAGNKSGITLSRLPFTLPEVEKLVSFLPLEWKRAVMLSSQTGTRLEDTLNIHSKQIRNGVLTYTQRKTGKTLSIPLVRWQEELDVKGYLCPTLRTGKVQNRSQEFVQLVADAGIKQSWTTFKSGRKVARKSFHSLRHTLRTLIVSSGGSDAQADLILGHSGQQGKTYTHSELEATRTTLKKVFTSS